MPAGTTAYLVIRRDDGFGDVFALVPGQRFTLGRANTNRIILKDEQCSREHAEVYYADGRWCLRDLNSLNGTRINSDPLDSEWELSPNDEINVGHTRLLFVEQMGQLPEVPLAPSDGDGVAIKKRQRHTRFLTPIPPLPVLTSTEQTPPPQPVQSNLNRQLSLLYRVALDMGSAGDHEELVTVVLDGLLEGTAADVGAILAVKEGRELEVVAHRHRNPQTQTYNRVSEYVSREVLDSKEAVIAEDVAEDRHLRNRESLADIGAKSVICAPVIF